MWRRKPLNKQLFIFRLEKIERELIINMQITDAQLKAIYYNLWQLSRNDYIQNQHIKEEWFKENLDLGTASDIIYNFMNDNPDAALAQLNHLGAEITIVPKELGEELEGDTEDSNSHPVEGI